MKFMVKATNYFDRIETNSAKEAIKDIENDEFEFENVVMDTEKDGYLNNPDITYNNIFGRFKIEAIDENENVVVTLEGHYEDISNFSESNYINVGDDFDSHEDCHVEYVKFLKKVSDEPKMYDKGYECVFTSFGSQRQTLAEVPFIWKPCFIVRYENKNDEVFKTVLKHLSGIIYRNYGFLPQELLMLDNLIEKKDKHLFKEATYKKTAGFYHKPCNQIFDEVNFM